MPIFLRIKTLRFHINALSATLDFALSPFMTWAVGAMTGSSRGELFYVSNREYPGLKKGGLSSPPLTLGDFFSYDLYPVS